MAVFPQLRLNPRAPTPLYWQVADALRGMIENGQIPDSTVLPAEADLASGWSVSRDTVRRAFEQLTRDGLLRRRRGSGTTVVTPVGCRAWLEGRDLASHLPAASDVRTAVTLRSSVVAITDESVASLLGIAEQSPVLEIVAVTFESGRPAAVDFVWRPGELASGEDTSPADRTFHRLLREVARSKGDGQELELDEVVRVAHLPDEAAAALGSPAERIGWLVERQLKSDGRVIEVRRTYTPAAGTELRRTVRASVGEPD